MEPSIFRTGEPQFIASAQPLEEGRKLCEAAENMETRIIRRSVHALMLPRQRIGHMRRMATELQHRQDVASDRVSDHEKLRRRYGVPTQDPVIARSEEHTSE